MKKRLMWRILECWGTKVHASIKNIKGMLGIRFGRILKWLEGLFGVEENQRID